MLQEGLMTECIDKCGLMLALKQFIVLWMLSGNTFASPAHSALRLCFLLRAFELEDLAALPFDAGLVELRKLQFLKIMWSSRYNDLLVEDGAAPESLCSSPGCFLLRVCMSSTKLPNLSESHFLTSPSWVIIPLHSLLRVVTRVTWVNWCENVQIKFRNYSCVKDHYFSAYYLPRSILGS